MREITVERDLFDGVGFARHARLVALDIVPGYEDAIAGDYFSRFKQSDVPNYDFLKQKREDQKW
jgi:hypothetical protein